MPNKITLITPPDIFENNNSSILFVNLSDEDQELASKYLASANINEDYNFYLFNDSSNMPWLFYTLGQCEYCYIDFNFKNFLVDALGSYIIGKSSNIFYKTNDENLASVYQYINQHRISDIQTFLESVIK